jgi:hypothetical protein
MASKAINRAVQNGVEMEEDVRERAEQQARGRFDKKNRSFDASGSANVALYALASSVGGMQDSDNSNEFMTDGLEAQAKDETDPMKRKAAEARLTQIYANRRELAQAKDVMVSRLSDKGFIAGFGSNGGEEFLSYMTLGESLVVDGGEDWTKWDREMTANLNRIQNPDGSWTGHHCITGRTFCTSAALLVLTVDRAPVPLAVKIRKES